MGRIRQAQKRTDVTLWDGSVGEGYELEVEASAVLGGAYIGCSIAVNGVCLTVTSISGSTYSVDVGPETLQRTTLGALQGGARAVA